MKEAYEAIGLRETGEVYTVAVLGRQTPAGAVDLNRVHFENHSWTERLRRVGRLQGVPKFRQRSVRIGDCWSGSGWSVRVFHPGVITSVDASASICDGAGDHLAIDAADCYSVEAACRGHFRNSLV